MAKLNEDPKVQALVEKEKAKAVKAEQKRCLDAVKEVVAEEVELAGDDKVSAKAAKTVGKAVAAAIKAKE